MATSPVAHSFRPGDIAPVSGVYRVLHAEHRSEHMVILLKGDEFPACRNCKSEVRFELAEPIDYAAHDWDFAGPNLRLVG